MTNQHKQTTILHANTSISFGYTFRVDHTYTQTHIRQTMNKYENSVKIELLYVCCVSPPFISPHCSMRFLFNWLEIVTRRVVGVSCEEFFLLFRSVQCFFYRYFVVTFLIIVNIRHFFVVVVVIYIVLQIFCFVQLFLQRDKFFTGASVNCIILVFRTFSFNYATIYFFVFFSLYCL